MLKKVFKILAIFIIGMVGGIFADQIFWPYFITPHFLSKVGGYQYQSEKQPIYLTEKKEIYIQENLALKNAVEKVEKTVVGVESKTKTGKTLEGSGIILTSDGLVVTLAELVPSGAQINIFWEDKTLSSKVLKRDLKENLALLKLEEKNLSTTGFANLEKLKLGERVFLVGAKKTVNEGIVRSFDENSIQTNILEEKIIAGSPLFNIEGNLLGLNTINKEGKVIAIPVSKIKSFSGF